MSKVCQQIDFNDNIEDDALLSSKKIEIVSSDDIVNEVSLRIVSEVFAYESLFQINISGNK